MSKRRGKKYSGLDPAVASYLTKDAVPNRAAMTAKQRRDRQRTRSVYDVEPVIKTTIEEIARKEDTSASQIGEMLLAYGIRAYLQKDSELMKALAERESSRTLRFSWNLRIPEEWLLALEAYLSEARKPRKWGQ